MQRTSLRAPFGAGLGIMILVAACGGGGAATPTPTPAAATLAPTTPVETAPPVATQGSTGAPSLAAAAEVQAGAEFEISWTGPNELNDYVTVVKLGATQWTNEDYFNTSGGSPQKLLAPTAPGDYELWYVSGASKEVLARRPLKILAFVGTLDAPASVEANKEFDIVWTGPNGPSDYVTIVKLGATKWTNEDYFNTSAGSPQKLFAPIEAGSYELWYVTGTDAVIQVRRPIAVTATSATLAAPAEVAKGAQFQVTWTGPNGPGDYITIVPVGSSPDAFLSYFNTSAGSPGTLTSPDAAGDYELRYVSTQGPTVISSVPIRVL